MTDQKTLDPHLRTFLRQFPDGWGESEWQGLLALLSQMGFGTARPDLIGARLEALRLDSVLQDVKGMGERRRSAFVARYPTLWNARQASADEIAQIPTIPGTVARQVHEALQP